MARFLRVISLNMEQNFLPPHFPDLCCDYTPNIWEQFNSHLDLHRESTLNPALPAARAAKCNFLSGGKRATFRHMLNSG